MIKTLKHLRFMLVMLLATLGVNVAFGEEVYTVLKNNAVNTADFVTGATRNTSNLPAGYTESVVLGGTASSLSGVNALNKIVRYDCKTTQTKVEVVVYNKNTSKTRNLVVYNVAEGATAATTDGDISIAKNTVETRSYNYNNTTNRSIYFCVPSNVADILILSITVTETGTPLKTPGEIGYSLNLNKGRLAAPAAGVTKIDGGIEVCLSSNYGVLNSANAAIRTFGTNYIKFTLPAAAKVKVTTASNVKFTFGSAKNSAGSKVYGGSSATHEAVLPAGTYFMNPVEGNSSNLSFTKIEFVAPPHSVTFDKNGATSADIEEQFIEDGEKATKPADPEKTDYDFAGWIVKDGDPEAVYNFDVPVTADVALIAKWQPAVVKEHYAITYNPGANGTGSIAPGDKTEDVAFTLSSERFTRDGYVQIGWATTEGGAKAYAVGGEYTANAAIELFPVWAETSTYVASFDAGDECSASTPADWTFANSGSYENNVATADYECKFGTTFPGEGAAVNANYIAFAKNAGVYAQYDLGAATTVSAVTGTFYVGSSSAKTFTIDYLGADGSTVLHTITVNHPASKNWGANNVDETAVVDNVRYIKIKGMSSSPSWIAMSAFSVTYVDLVTKYNVSFDPNGGSGEMSTLKYAEGAVVTLPKCTFAAPDNQEFDAWTSDDVTITDGKFTMPAKAVAIIATWKIAQTYAVTYELNGGEGTLPTQDNVTEGEGFAINTGAEIHKTDSRFLGWKANVDLTINGENVPAGTLIKNRDVEIDLATGANANGTNCSFGAPVDGVLTVNYDFSGAAAGSWPNGGVEFALDNLTNVTGISFDYFGNNASLWTSFIAYLTDENGIRWYNEPANLNINGQSVWASESYMPTNELWTSGATQGTTFTKIGFLANCANADANSFKLRNVKVLLAPNQVSNLQSAVTLTAQWEEIDPCENFVVTCTNGDGSVEWLEYTKAKNATDGIYTLNIHSVAGGDVAKYEWYRNTVESHEGANLVRWNPDGDTEYASSYSKLPSTDKAGTFFYFCKLTSETGCETYSKYIKYIVTGVNYASSIDLETIAGSSSNNGNTPDVEATLGASDIAISTTAGATWDNNNKFADKGLKIKNSGTTISFVVEPGKLVTVVFGSTSGAKFDGEALPVKVSGDDNQYSLTKYYFSDTEKTYTYVTTTSSYNILKSITISDPYTVQFDVDGGTAIEPATFKGTGLTLVDAEKADMNFDGWFTDDARTAPVTFNKDDGKFYPTASCTLYAKFVDKYDRTALESLKYGEDEATATVIELVADQTTYDVVLPYKAAIPNVYASVPVADKSTLGTITQATAETKKATFTVTAEDGTTTADYVINFIEGPKDGVSIIKAELTSPTAANYSGMYADATNSRIALKNDNGKNKFSGNSNYVKLALENGTFQEGDILKMTYSADPTQGELAVYAEQNVESSKLCGIAHENAELTFTDAVNGKSVLYICRTSGNDFNGWVSAVEVVRVMAPVMTSFKVGDRVATIDEEAKTVYVKLAHGADVTAITPEIEFVSNDNAQATVTPAGAQDFTSSVDYTITDKDGDATTYTVTVAVAGETVAKIADAEFDNLQEAFDAAVENDVIVLQADVDVPATVVVDKKVTLDLNGKKIYNTTDLWEQNAHDWSLISVRGEGDLTITGNGTMDAKADDCYALDVQDVNAKLTIENGIFNGNIHAVYVFAGLATINGGHYDIYQKSTQYAGDPNAFLLNCYDANRANGTAKIVINAGTFVGFDPSNNKAEGAGNDFCADGFIGDDLGDGNFGVKPASQDASIATLTINGQEVAMKEAGTYSYVLPYGATDVPVVAATATDAQATVVVTPTMAMTGTAVVTVTSEDRKHETVVTINFSVMTEPIYTIFDGSTMSAIANTSYTDPYTGIAWSMASNVPTNADNLSATWNEKTYTKGIKSFKPNGNSNNIFSITIPEMYAAKVTLVGTTNSKDNARSLFISKTAGSVLDESLLYVTSSTYAAVGATAVLAPGTYYLNSTDACRLFELSIELIPFEDVRANVQVDRMYSYCPAQNVAAGMIAGAEFYQPESFDGSYVNLVQVSELKAGYGYVMIPTAEDVYAYFNGDVKNEAVAAEDAGNGMQGFLSADPSATQTIADSQDNIVIVNNHLHYAGGNYMGVGRAYIRLDLVKAMTSDPTNVAPRRRVGFANNTTTGIDAIQMTEETQKVMLEGQLYIIRGGRMYNVNGVLVK